MSDFNLAVVYVLRNEDGEPFATDDGDYTDDPVDPGGATKFGVTLLDLQEYRKNPTLTPSDVQALTKEEGVTIIKEKYWMPLGLDAIKSNGVATATLDMAYNKGKSGWTKQVQAQLGLAADGIMGPQTIAAMNAQDPAQFIKTMVAMAMVSYEARIGENPRLKRFLNGWTARANRLLTLIGT